MSGQSWGDSLYRHTVKHGVEKSLFSSSDIAQNADTRKDFGLKLASRIISACSAKLLLL